VKLSIVAAVSENGVIGRGEEIPWRLRDEQQALKKLTTGHCLIMGRKTWESIGRPLPGRTSIVITRDPRFSADFDEVVVVRDFDSAVGAARERGDDETFVFGGEAIYALALPRADLLYITRVHAKVEGDAFFPAFDEAAWKLVAEEHHEADARNEHAFTAQRYERA
jgi:dihydrofolate reductase